MRGSYHKMAAIAWKKLLLNMKCTKVPGTLARFMQISTCAYLISTCGIRRACHFSQNG